MDLDNLNSSQLKRFISEANNALSRRQKIEKAMIEIQRISKKHKLSKSDLKIVLAALQSSTASAKNKPKTARAKVEAKYQSPDGSKTWTGRGRSPSWVVEICRSEKLTIERFKSDPRFLIQNSSRSHGAID